MINIQEAVENFKELIHSSILTGGRAGIQSMIRSSKPINNIHEAVKSELVRSGIDSSRIFPPMEKNKPELRLAGFFKQKYQDVCVAPNGYVPEWETLTAGLLQDESDKYGKVYTERTLSINIRSQISSLTKNFDTMYERTFAEALNLHIRCPKMVMGEVYMIAVPEYDSKVMKDKVIRFIDKKKTVEKYIKSFEAINGRIYTTTEKYKYERVCLLIVDFNQSPVKIYHNNDELIEAGLLNENSKVSIENLTWESFIPSLLATYETRFGI